MNVDSFTEIHKNLEKNIEEIKKTIKKSDILNSPNRTKTIERLTYLFYSLTKTLVDIGHGIVLENDFRDPLNRADIFISLAEKDIVLPSAVPGAKKAVLALPKMQSCQHSEILEIISESINDLHKMLDSFAVYFKLKDTKI